MVQFLIDEMGRCAKVGKRSVAVAILQGGNIHILSTQQTIIITLQPNAVSPLTLAAAAYAIADLTPDRSIVVAGLQEPQCWVFPGYLMAIQKIASLIEAAADVGTGSMTDGVRFLT